MQSLNRLVYTTGNPTGMTDPRGHGDRDAGCITNSFDSSGFPCITCGVPSPNPPSQSDMVHAVGCAGTVIAGIIAVGASEGGVEPDSVQSLLTAVGLVTSCPNPE